MVDPVHASVQFFVFMHEPVPGINHASSKTMTKAT